MKDDLIGRLEAATADSAELMREAWSFINGPEPASGYTPRSVPPFCPKWEAYIKARCRFQNLLEAEAYESAAIKLVPEGWFVHRLHQWVVDNFNWSCDLAKKDLSNPKPVSAEDCPTPALAIVIAALRAMP